MSTVDKSELFNLTDKQITDLGFTIESVDQNRPWGGFFVINEEQAQEFANEFFDGLDTNELRISGKLSPKILIVAPNKRLSWQYHHRRAEIWRCIKGKVGVIKSSTNDENDLIILNEGEYIQLPQGERHRLVGLDDYGIVAEIWQHTDSNHPSTEDDIVRIQDDFGR